MTTTTTTPTSSASTAATGATAVSRRPLTLTRGAAILRLAALLTLAFPFIPRGRGFFGVGNRAAGARQGQGNDQGGAFTQGQGNGQGGGFTQGQGNGQGGGFTQGGGQGGGFGGGNGQAGGFAAGRGGANVAIFRMMAPVRITLGLIGGLFMLVAAWGIWQRRKWGMVLALIAAAGMLLTGAFSVILPLAGRTVTRALGSGLFFSGFIASPQWLSIVGIILALAVAVLVFLPASQKGFISRPKERRVM